MRIPSRVLLAAVLALALGQPRVAQATPLNLSLALFPDILSQFIDVSYDAGTDVFQATGFSLSLRTGVSTTISIANGSFGLTASTPDGSSVPSGTLLVRGDIGGGVVTLIQGSIVGGAAMGSSSSGPGLFEFVFATTGGVLQGDYGSQIGVILGAGGNSTYTGSFASSFDNISGVAGSGTGSADTAPPVPEPGTLLLMGSGVAGLLLYGRQRGETRRRRHTPALLLGIALALGLARPATAALLDLPLQFPLLTFDNGGALSYDAGSELLAVDANPIAMRLSPADPPRVITPVPGATEFFDIRIEVDHSGALVGGNPGGPDLEVFGQVDLNGDSVIDASGVLLTGTATGFGFQESGATDLFDFRFTKLGGALASSFGDDLVVALQSEHSSFSGSFEEDFQGGAKGTLGNTPEPGTVMLLGAGLLGLGVWGRRRD